MRRRLSIVAVILAGLGAGLTAPGNTSPPGLAGDPGATLTLRPAAKLDLAASALDLAHTNRGSGATRRTAVTDIVVRLRSAGEGRLSTLLGLADGDRPGRGRVLFTAELIVAAGGRVVIEERARCAPWVAGASICRTECDGGAFAILRQSTPHGQVLALRFGRVDPAEVAAVRLGACRDTDADDLSLQPRAGHSSAEVPLQAE
ncbi:MAG: hypothetical protein ACKVP7_12625 [Hyphomicrobiaceae bacterium]